MNQTIFLVAAIASCVISGCSGLQSPTDPSIVSSQAEVQSWRDFVGTWHVTTGVRSLVLSIHDDEQVLVLYMRPGQHSINHVKWKPFHGGILILDVTRLRLWPGRNHLELRAEAEHDPTKDLDDLEFPVRFFMRRVNERQLPQRMLDRPLLESWKQETLDESWDATAGRRVPALTESQ